MQFLVQQLIEAAGPPPHVWEELWLAVSRFFAESKLLRGLELAALGHWVMEHWVFTLGAAAAAVWVFGAMNKR